MNDFSSLEKTIVRELSCRMCLCTDVTKLKPLSAEVKRKIKKLFNVMIRTDDNLPKAICHECLQQIGVMHLYTVKVEKTQKFLDFYKRKALEEKSDMPQLTDNKIQPITAPYTTLNNVSNTLEKPEAASTKDQHQGDTKTTNTKASKRKSPLDMKFLESMPLEEFAKTESVDKSLLNSSKNTKPSSAETSNDNIKNKHSSETRDHVGDSPDPIVLVDGKPARQGPALDKQITLFYKMECCICHEKGFHFRSLLKHYKDRHGVPGYVTCCDKKFHYFYPKKIIEHMAYHLQPDIFMCSSCHQNFHTSQELIDHQSNGGHSEGKIICPRCSERFATYHELGWHLVIHRSDKFQCDYCGKILKHHHRKKTVNQMEDVILCSQCVRTLKNIEKQEKDFKEKMKNNDSLTLQKYDKFKQAMGLSGDDDASTE